MKIKNAFAKVFLILSFLFLIKLENKRIKFIKRIEKDSIIIQDSTLELNKENVKYIVYKHCKYPDIVLKQIYFETGHLKSEICQKNNNLFGMKKPKRRKTLCIGENKGHGVFNSWIDSIKDYALYQSERNILSKSRDEYLEFLQRTYSTNKNYTKVLLQVPI